MLFVSVWVWDARLLSARSHRSRVDRPSRSPSGQVEPSRKMAQKSSWSIESISVRCGPVVEADRLDFGVYCQSIKNWVSHHRSTNPAFLTSYAKSYSAWQLINHTCRISKKSCYHLWLSQRLATFICVTSDPQTHTPNFGLRHRPYHRNIFGSFQARLLQLSLIQPSTVTAQATPGYPKLLGLLYHFQLSFPTHNTVTKISSLA